MLRVFHLIYSILLIQFSTIRWRALHLMAGNTSFLRIFLGQCNFWCKPLTTFLKRFGVYADPLSSTRQPL